MIDFPIDFAARFEMNVRPLFSIESTRIHTLSGALTWCNSLKRGSLQQQGIDSHQQ